MKRNQACPGAGKYPKEMTRKPKGGFSGYGLCSECEKETAMTLAGTLVMHRDRRLDVSDASRNS